MEEKRKRLTNAITGDRKGQERHSLSESTRTLITPRREQVIRGKNLREKGNFWCIGGAHR